MVVRNANEGVKWEGMKMVKSERQSAGGEKHAWEADKKTSK